MTGKDFLYENDLEKNEHLQAVHFLAENEGISKTDVLALYEEALEDLKSVAVIKSYLSVLVSRRVRNILHRKRYPFNA